MLIAVAVVVGIVVAFGGGGDSTPTTVPWVSTTVVAEPTTTSVAPEPTPRGVDEVAPGWIRLDGGPLARRTEPAVAWTGREIIVVGGTGSGEYADGAAFDVAAHRWRPMAEPPISPTADREAAAWTGQEVVVFTTTETVAYDPLEDSWRITAARPEEARHPVGAVWTGSEVMFVAHIQHRPRLLDRLVAVAYDPSTDSWRRLADPPEAMSYASVLWHGGRVVLVGGFLDSNNLPRSWDGAATAQAYDEETGDWIVLDGLSLAPNAVVAASTPDGVLAWEYRLKAMRLGSDDTWGKANPIPLDFFECYPQTVSLSQLVFAWYCGQAALYLPDADAWVEIDVPDGIGDGLLIGGGDEAFVWSHDGGDATLWRLDPERAETEGLVAAASGDGWRFVPILEMASRDDPSLVWTGEQLIAWGGHGHREEVYDGFAYDPDTGASRRLPDTSYPGRFGQEAVWTGDEMIVWPASEAWSPVEGEWRSVPTSEAGFPTGPLTWTGREVISLGSYEVDVAGGLAYDPATEAWRSLTSSPLQGSDAAVAWSGSELYVWGPGLPERRFWYQEGAAYDPAADTWRRLPSLPEDLNLSGPVATWSGSEFLVLGVARNRGTTALPEIAGAVYAPGSGAWRLIDPLPLSTPDDDGLAGSLLATWTGTEMAVWLPAPYFGETPQLAFYDPAADAWTLSNHLDFTATAWEMVSTGDEVAVLTDRGLLLHHADGPWPKALD